MLHIDHFKKQAKQYLRWQRQGHFPVAAAIRSGLPRFRDMNDSEILQMNFKLSHAQELVARRAGFESWAALLKGVNTVSDPSAALPIEKSVILFVEPLIFVSNIERASDFYTQKLGFRVVFSYGEPAFFVQVARGGARLNLRLVSGPVFDSGFRVREQDPLSVVLTLDDAKPLFLELLAAGVTFHQSLRTEPWGARTFVVQDPDGNLIGFAGGPG
jgi:catechol 2,3-dioxygenase-like lactoylglutathione lyase family enzyme